MHAVIDRAIITHHSVTLRHGGCSLRRRQETRLLRSGPFPPESGPDSREPLTARTWTTSAFVISCRPVGFRMRQGARSFPPPPLSSPFHFLNGRDAATAPVPPPGAWVEPGSLPLPRGASPPRSAPRQAARAALRDILAPSPAPPREGRAGWGWRGLLVAVGLVAPAWKSTCAKTWREVAGTGHYPGVPCLFPPRFGAPQAWLSVGGGDCALSHQSRLSWETQRFSFFVMRARVTFNIYLRKHMLSKTVFPSHNKWCVGCDYWSFFKKLDVSWML